MMVDERKDVIVGRSLDMTRSSTSSAASSVTAASAMAINNASCGLVVPHPLPNNKVVVNNYDTFDKSEEIELLELQLLENADSTCVIFPAREKEMKKSGDQDDLYEIRKKYYVALRTLSEGQQTQFGNRKYSTCLSDEMPDERRSLNESMNFKSIILYPSFTATMPRRKKKHQTLMTLWSNRYLLDGFQKEQTRFMLSKSQLTSWNFNAFILDRLTNGLNLPTLCTHILNISGLSKHFSIDPLIAWNFFSIVERGYHQSNPYHNAVHAADVTQALFCYLMEDKMSRYLEPLEKLAVIIASVCHDLDHPGRNEKFLVESKCYLASLYNHYSVLEFHHWRSAISCLCKSGLMNELQKSPHFDRNDFEKLIQDVILATDVSKQPFYLQKFRQLMDANDQEINLENKENRRFVLQLAMKCADISNPCRTWNISRLWSYRACEEFFRQGDAERQLDMDITSSYDRYSTTIANVQSSFYRVVAVPLFEEWHQFMGTPLSTLMINNMFTNQARWELLVQQESLSLVSESLASLNSSTSSSGSFDSRRNSKVWSRNESLLDHNGGGYSQGSVESHGGGKVRRDSLECPYGVSCPYVILSLSNKEYYPPRRCSMKTPSFDQSENSINSITTKDRHHSDNPTISEEKQPIFSFPYLSLDECLALETYTRRHSLPVLKTSKRLWSTSSGSKLNGRFFNASNAKHLRARSEEEGYINNMFNCVSFHKSLERKDSSSVGEDDNDNNAYSINNIAHHTHHYQYPVLPKDLCWQKRRLFKRCHSSGGNCISSYGSSSLQLGDSMADFSSFDTDSGEYPMSNSYCTSLKEVLPEQESCGENTVITCSEEKYIAIDDHDDKENNILSKLRKGGGGVRRGSAPSTLITGHLKNFSNVSRENSPNCSTNNQISTTKRRNRERSVITGHQKKDVDGLHNVTDNYMSQKYKLGNLDQRRVSLPAVLQLPPKVMSTIGNSKGVKNKLIDKRQLMMKVKKPTSISSNVFNNSTNTERRIQNNQANKSTLSSAKQHKRGENNFMDVHLVLLHNQSDVRSKSITSVALSENCNSGQLKDRRSSDPMLVTPFLNKIQNNGNSRKKKNKDKSNKSINVGSNMISSVNENDSMSNLQQTSFPLVVVGEEDF